jgi:hypothetical protein
MQWLKKINLERLDELLRKLEANKYMPYFQEYLTLGEEIRTALPFKSYYTLWYGSWSKDLDDDSLKSTWKKWKRDDREG